MVTKAKKDRPEWVMPAWMEKYREHFTNTGGNRVEWLMNLTGDDTKNNSVLAALCCCAESQVGLLHRLKEAGMLS